jgi:pilus assembly protein Flp/PilA
MNMLKRFIRDESGLELSEYAVMVGLIVIAVILIVTQLGTHIADIFRGLDGALPAGTPAT